MSATVPLTAYQLVKVVAEIRYDDRVSSSQWTTLALGC